MKTTKLLMADHERILQALQILREITTGIENGSPMNNEDIRSLLDFFRDFADGSHHVKEEAILFPGLMQAGMSLQDAPLRVMCYEHERGRALVAAMDESLGRDNINDFIMYARRYQELLTAHIEKEKYVLFEIADRTLTDDEDETIAGAFDHFDKTIVGSAACQRFRRIIDDLAAKYLGLRVPVLN